MKISLDTIVSYVLKKLDENEEIAREKESYGISGTALVDLIEDLFEEVACDVILEAECRETGDCKEGEGEVEWDGPGRGSVSLPDDFLRLVRFRMSDWRRGVTKVIEYGSASYDLRFWSRRESGDVRKSPAVAIRGGFGVKILEFIGSKDPGAYVEELGYIPVPRPDAEGMVVIPERLVPKITDRLAERVRRIRNQTE